MATALARQLQQVSLALGQAPAAQKAGQASVLYTAREAADIDTQTILKISKQGKLYFISNVGS